MQNALKNLTSTFSEMVSMRCHDKDGNNNDDDDDEDDDNTEGKQRKEMEHWKQC